MQQQDKAVYPQQQGYIPNYATQPSAPIQPPDASQGYANQPPPYLTNPGNSPYPPAAQPFIAQPVVQLNPVIPMGQGDWNKGLCNCTEDCGTCIVACFLPCVTFGQNTERLFIGMDCLTAGAIYCAINYLSGCGCLYSAAMRGEWRKKSGIKGNYCNDCCTHCWCSPCAMTQEKAQADFLESKGIIPRIVP